MATRAEIRARALQVLGVVRIGQSAKAEDDTEIGTAYDELYEKLKKEGLATWVLTGNVPLELAPHVVRLVALSRTDGTYPISNDRLQRLVLQTGQNGELSLREIRRLTTTKHESLEEPRDF